MSTDVKHTELNADTKIPIYFVYALGLLLVAITGYLVRIDSGLANVEARVDRHKEAILRMQDYDKEMAKQIGENAVHVGEVVGELKALKEFRESKK